VLRLPLFACTLQLFGKNWMARRQDSAAVPVAAYIGKGLCLLAVCDECLNVAQIDTEDLVQAHGKEFTIEDLEKHLRCKKCNSLNARIRVSESPDDAGRFRQPSPLTRILRHRILFLSMFITGAIFISALGLIGYAFLNDFRTPTTDRFPVAAISLEFTEKVNSLKEENIKLKAALAENTGRVGALERQVSELHKRNESARSEISSALLGHQTELKRAQLRSVELAQEINRLKAGRDEAERAADAHIATIETMRQQLIELAKKFDSAQHQLIIKNATLAKAHDRADREIASLRMGLEGIRAQLPTGSIAKIHSMLAKHETGIERAQQRNAEINAEINKLKAERDERDKSLLVKLEVIETVRRKMAKFVEEYSRDQRQLKMENAALREALDREDREIVSLQKSLEEIKNQVSAVGDSEEALGEGNSVSDGVAAYNAGEYGEAYRIWRDLAESGNGRAQFHLGALYYEGRGVPQNLREAQTWLRRALENESSLARSLLERVEDELRKGSATAGGSHPEMTPKSH